MFDVEMLPADPILGLTEAFKGDSNPKKINLGVGVYKDSTGRTPIQDSVKRAERILLDSEQSKSYLPIPGDAGYQSLVQELLFGKGSSALSSGRVVTAQTPGGTGALRVGADLLKNIGAKRVFVSDPTWANHKNIFSAAGIEILSYPYYDASSKSMKFEDMVSCLESETGAGDIVLLQGCCHNPTGIDPSKEQWTKLLEVCQGKNVIPFFDFAYQGLGSGLEDDAAGIRIFAESGIGMLGANSFSKIFGLFNERVGGLSIAASDSESAGKLYSHLKAGIRRNYSNPPFHGGGIVKEILSDAGLRQLWEKEVGQMRERISKMRSLFVQTLKDKGAKMDFSFIVDQQGMFSFSGLGKEQVQKLRDDYSIYIVGSGRINVAGMTEDNMDYLCSAVVDVL